MSSSGYKVNKQFIKSEIDTHPDYPAMTTLTDLLDTSNFDYVARRASIEDIEDFNFPCLAYLNIFEKGKGLYQINNPTELKEMNESWNGIILYTTSESKFENPANDAAIKKNNRNIYAFVFITFFLFAVSAASSLSNKNLYYAVWLLTGAIGISFCLLLISQEIGLVTEIVQKVCGIGGNKTGCAKVLNSKNAKLKFGISIAELAFAYFTSQWLVFLSAPYVSFAATASTTIVSIAAGGILILAWSVYTQKYVLKQWCTLCLGLACVLALQSILSATEKGSFNWLGILYPSLLFTCILSFTHPIKKTLEKVNELGTQQRELIKWKKDTYLFLKQWEDQPRVDCNPFERELELANPNGVLQFTIACNPYCNPCALAHRKMDAIVDAYGNAISVRVRFNIRASDKENKTTKAVNLILNAVNESNSARKVINEWFEKMDYDYFAQRWPIKNNKCFDILLSKHESWNTIAEIQFTPTIFLNGKELPKRYAIDDLLPMVPELYHHLQLSSLTGMSN